MFSKILIANRGEIACGVVKTATAQQAQTGIGALARPALLLACLLIATGAGHGRAQNARDAEAARDNEVSSVLMGLEIGVGFVAAMVVASQRCGYGDADGWVRVVNAIDRRYSFCAARDPYWTAAVERAFEKQVPEARARGSSTGMGSLAFEFLLPTATRQFEAKYASGGCLSFPKEMVEGVAPATVRQLFDLGKDSAWIEAPCDKFYPASNN